MGTVEEESLPHSPIPVNERWLKRQQERERLGIVEEIRTNEQRRFLDFMREGIEQGRITFGEDSLPVEKGPTSIHHAIKRFYRPEAAKQEEPPPVTETPMHQMTDKESAYFGYLTNRVRAEVSHRDDILPQEENSMHRLVKRLNKKIRTEGV